MSTQPNSTMNVVSEVRKLSFEASLDSISREASQSNLFYNTLRSLSLSPTSIEDAYFRIESTVMSTLLPRKGKEKEEGEIEYSPDQRYPRLLAKMQARFELQAATKLLNPIDISQQAETLRLLQIHILELGAGDREIFNRALYHTKNEFFKDINSAIDPVKLDEFKRAIKEVMTTTPEKEQREHTFGFALGYVSSGKGTALAANKIKAVETGTEGILGHAEKFGYNHWKNVVAPFDELRGYGIFFPDALMTISTGIEILGNRFELDAKGEFHKAVYLSGFPRTPEQANSFFAGIEPKTIAGAVFLTIDKETAFERTIFRMFEDLLTNGVMRQDDVDSIMGSDSGSVTMPILLETIRQFVEAFRTEVLSGISPLEIETIRSAIMNEKIGHLRTKIHEFRQAGYDLNPQKARWFADVKKKDETMAVLKNLGIELVPIDVSTMTFEEEAAAVGKALLN